MSAWTLKATKGGGDGQYERAPAGNHPAVCVGMIDMGTQETKFGDEVKQQYRIFFVWELTTEKAQNGRNHVIGIDLTFSLNEKAKMRQWIEARLGRKIAEGEEYDISQELGKPCLLNVVEKNGYPKIEGISAVPKGMTVAPPTVQPFAWHLSEFDTSGGKIELPDWVPWLYGKTLADHIRNSEELAGRSPQPSAPSATGAQPGSQPPAGQSPASQAAPSGSSAPRSPSKPAPPKPAPPATARDDVLFWVDLGNGEVCDQPVNKAGAGHLLFEKGLKPDTTLVTVDGTDDWKPAVAFGIAHPF